MVDYNNITPFERKYIKPVIPFYAWKKGNIPLQVSQMIAQTPKYTTMEHLKDAISEDISGQPTDNKGRIQTNQVLPDGSRVVVDPYMPLDEPMKIMDKGPLSWALGTFNPFVREAIAQGSSALGEFFPKSNNGVQNQYSIYNASAPADYNVRKGIAHAINAVDPVSGSVALSNALNAVHSIFPQVSTNPNQVVNQLFGLPSKEPPGMTGTESIAKLFGGFSGRVNPQKDAKNAQYDARDQAQGMIKYLKETGQSIPKQLKKDAYRKVR
jgi:hypothetical protein